MDLAHIRRHSPRPALKSIGKVTGPVRQGVEIMANNPSNRWLNPAAFSLPQAFTFGNALNLIDDVRNPSFRVENFSAI